MALLWVFLGCGIGGMLRYWVSVLLRAQSFPYATLIVNVSGSFLIGLLASLFLARWNHLSFLKPLLLVGFLGGYTTFSSFSLETWRLLESGNHLGAICNIALSLILCLFAVWLGLCLGRQIA